MLGLRLPWRATVAIVLVALVVLADFSRTLLPDELATLGRSPLVLRITAIERAILFALVPLAVVLFAFRDRPSRYGLALGDWRSGLALMLFRLRGHDPDGAVVRDHARGRGVLRTEHRAAPRAAVDERSST